MAVAGAQIAGAASAADAARDWQAMRGDADIQYAPLPPVKPPEPPSWLEPLFKLIGKLFELLGKPLLFLLVAALVLIIAWLLWRIARSYLDREKSGRTEEPEWAPDRAAATALLGDADRLAAEGRFGEAVHLLLQRSVGHISDARPDWLMPASTAREIAVFPMLPERARQAFGVIATRVERSLFALRDLDEADWTAARGAYADFALADFRS